MSDLRLVFWILCGGAGISIGWGLAGDNTPAVLAGALILLGVIVAAVLALAAGGIKASTRNRERHDADRRR